MSKQITITIDDKVYEELSAIVDNNSISKFIEDLLRPLVLKQDLESAYREMALDEERKNKAMKWAQATIADIADEAWHSC